MNDSNAGARSAGAWRGAPFRYAACLAAISAWFAGHPSLAQELYTVTYRDADIRTVVEQVQQVIHRPMIIDSRVRARLTILSNAPITADAFYQSFVAALEVHGLVARDAGNAIMIVPVGTTQSQGIRENRE